MCNSIVSLLLGGVLIGSILLTAEQTAQAQGLSLPAEMNKSFSPISILPGGISRLSVTLFNPNVFELTHAAWIDNLIGIQPGLSITRPANLSNTCGGTCPPSAVCSALVPMRSILFWLFEAIGFFSRQLMPATPHNCGLIDKVEIRFVSPFLNAGVAQEKWRERHV